MHAFAMFVSFSSLLTHPTGQRYDTQQLEGEVVNMITPISFKYDVSLRSTI